MNTKDDSVQAAIINRGRGPEIAGSRITVYGDLDVSVIDELPLNRKSIKTGLRFEEDRDNVYRFLREEVKKGRQVYIVYPIIEESEKLDLKSAVKHFEILRKDIFPDFNLFIYGGVNYEPYRKKLEESIGKKVDSIELYPASEGFIAYQDKQKDPSLLLMVNSGIFFEFIPASEYFNANPTRISLKDVEPDVNYAVIINSNAGLWGYSLGDTIKFVSTNPYKIIVTGRIKHFISAFGEHIIAEEVEKALLKAAHDQHAEVVEFTVAPQVSPAIGLPYHEWFIEFHKQPDDMERFRLAIDESLQKQNIYYRDLIVGHVLQPLKIQLLQKNAFIRCMRSMGKLGGQNKVPRLSNDRILADELGKYTL